jgi:hypothetical protein
VLHAYMPPVSGMQLGAAGMAQKAAGMVVACAGGWLPCAEAAPVSHGAVVVHVPTQTIQVDARNMCFGSEVASLLSSSQRRLAWRVCDDACAWCTGMEYISDGGDTQMSLFTSEPGSSDAASYHWWWAASCGAAYHTRKLAVGLALAIGMYAEGDAAASLSRPWQASLGVTACGMCSRGRRT